MTSSGKHSDGIGVSSGLRRATVLLVDEDPSFPNQARAFLDDDFFSLQWAATPDQAHRLVARHGADLALITVSARDPSAWRLIDQLRSTESTRQTPVVILATEASVLNEERVLNSGAVRALLKPASPETLQRVVYEVLGTRNEAWWHLLLDRKGNRRLRELLFDPTTEIPTIAFVVEELRRVIESGEALHVFCIEIEPLFSLGERKFWDSFDLLRREFVRGLQVSAASLLGNDLIVATSHPGANEFYCFARSSAMSVTSTARELENLAKSLLGRIRADPWMVNETAVFVGGSATQPHPIYAPRVLYGAVREAKDIAERRETRYFQALHERLRRAMDDNAILTHFQPVLDLATRTVIGYEALSRGPAGTDLESPEVIFGLARDFNVVWELEALCIRNVEPLLEEVCSGGLLFFNLESNFIQELADRGTAILEPFLRCENRVVLEVTERTAIRDYRSFRQTMRELKTMGFRVAIDDCGSGYATLEAVAELHPDYLKVGQSLFQNVEGDPIRRRLVDLVARCADSIGATTVAEAVETAEQLAICHDLGIQLGQGFYFARPAPWDEIRQP
jgi:EAL domain-containing protein (putative c-di-GMP-specific phosphodiesterase class I)/DNA-binding response OmpR family regulator